MSDARYTVVWAGRKATIFDLEKHEAVTLDLMGKAQRGSPRRALIERIVKAANDAASMSEADQC